MIRRASGSQRRGFRLIDLLTAVSLAACVLGLLLPQLVARAADDDNVREKANRAVSVNNLKQITLAAINNCDQNNGDMPGVYTNTNFDGKAGTTGSIFYIILPQMDQEKVFKEGMTAKNIYKSTGGKVPMTAIKTLHAPGDPTGDVKKPWTSYIANAQAFPSYDLKEMQSPNRFPGGIADGVKNTVAFTEAHAQTADKPRLWHDGDSHISTDGSALFESAPEKMKAKPALAQSYYKSGISVSLFDGSVRVVKPAVSEKTWKAAFTPAGNDKLGTDW